MESLAQRCAWPGFQNLLRRQRFLSPRAHQPTRARVRHFVIAHHDLARNDRCAIAFGVLQQALAAGGQDGLYRALEILEAEIKNSMGLIGLTSIAEIDKSFITEAPAVTEAHELGAYPFLPEGTRL